MRRFSFRPLILPSLLLTALVGQSAQAYDYTAPVPLHTTAKYDPSSGTVPFPIDLLRQGSTDLTLNIPIAAGTPAAQVGVYNALNSLDGFSTTAPWSTTFAAPLTASSVAGGQSVHLFEVKTDPATGAVLGVVRELASPQEYVATLASNAASGATLALVPTRPLKQLTSYMAVLTNAITDAGGAPTRQSLVYGFAKRTKPLCVNGATTLPALPSAQACALEPLRQLVNLQEAAANTAGVNPSTITLSWTATTQATTVVMQAITGLIDAAPNKSPFLVSTGVDLSKISGALPPVADVYAGSISVPYYLGAPTADNPTAPLTAYWQAQPGAYVPPFNKLGLDPTSTNVTIANPFPVMASVQRVAVLASIPNANSGKTKPASGWPVVIFQHGITRNRTDMLAVAGGLAAAGFAVIAMDLPLHGVTDKTNPFYRNQLLGLIPDDVLPTERTFDLDLQNNSTGASGPDGNIDSSGSYFINLTSLRTSRDNLRQGVADMLELRSAIPSVLANDGTPVFDPARVGFMGQSLGSIEGTTFMSLAATPNTAVQNAVLNVPGGGITGLLLGSPTFAPVIIGGLGAAGIKPGTADFNTFVVATQTVIDSGDPINYAGDAGTGAVLAKKNLLVHEVVGGKLSGHPSIDIPDTAHFDSNGNWLPDQVIPNSVATSPLSGTDPLVAVLGLSPIFASTQSATGIRGVVRFIAGTHGSLLGDAPAADGGVGAFVTVEMQTEAASFFASNGLAVKANVVYPTVIRTQ